MTKLGAHEVVDYANDGVDVVGGETQARSWSALRPGSVLVSVVAPPDAQQAAESAGVLHHRAERANLHAIARLVETGRLTRR